jgi:hypothetical protein
MSMPEGNEVATVFMPVFFQPTNSRISEMLPAETDAASSNRRNAGILAVATIVSPDKSPVFYTAESRT